MHNLSDDYHYVCDRNELALNVPKAFEVDERFVVVVATSSGVYCIEDVCTHDGGSLSDGEFDGRCMVCPRHGAKFDVKTGKAICMPATEPTPSHTVKIDGDKVFIQLNS